MLMSFIGAVGNLMAETGLVDIMSSTFVTGPAKINHLSAKKSATFFIFALS